MSFFPTTLFNPSFYSSFPKSPPSNKAWILCRWKTKASWALIDSDMDTQILLIFIKMLIEKLHCYVFEIIFFFLPQNAQLYL